MQSRRADRGWVRRSEEDLLGCRIKHQVEGTSAQQRQGLSSGMNTDPMETRAQRQWPDVLVKPLNRAHRVQDDVIHAPRGNIDDPGPIRVVLQRLANRSRVVDVP